MNRLAFFAALAATLTAAAPRLSRAELKNLERSFDRRISLFSVDDPFDRLGDTRGVYLENYGVIFTSEVNLVTGPAITPFRPQITDEDKEKLRLKKISRLPDMRRMMRDMMVTSATALKSLPMDQRVVVGVTLFHQPWEKTAGLPSQIVMQARRQSLTDFEAGRIQAVALDQAIEEQVY